MRDVFALAKDFIDLPLLAIEVRWRTRFTRYADRINNWDLVDRAAPYVIVGYLSDKPLATLYTLARSVAVE